MKKIVGIVVDLVEAVLIGTAIFIMMRHTKRDDEKKD